MKKVDYKIWNKELYAPSTTPSDILVPPMNFIMVDGHGNPNDEEGEYSKAVELLYALSYSIKMNRKKSFAADDEFTDYVVPPLEGLWWLEDISDMNFTQKDKYCWTSMIRQPEFITDKEFEQAKAEVQMKKPGLDPTKARFETFEEGFCIQCMHIGPYDTEPATIEKMDRYMQEQGYTNNIGTTAPDGRIRRHHEIYLSDPRKGSPSTRKTILRHPVRKPE